MVLVPYYDTQFRKPLMRLGEAWAGCLSMVKLLRPINTWRREKMAGEVQLMRTIEGSSWGCLVRVAEMAPMGVLGHVM